MTTEAENISLVEEFYDVINTDKDRFLDIVAEDYVFNGSEIGNKGYLETHRRLHGPFPDYQNEVDRIFADGNMVVAQWRGLGTHTGQSYWGIPPTGTEIEGSGITIFRIEDGEIAESWAHWDHIGLLQQAGVIPENFREIQARSQILEVLLRVLRHNIRNDLNVVGGRADLIAQELAVDSEHLEQIQQKIDSLAQRSEKVREVAEHIARGLEVHSFNVVEVVESVKDDLKQANQEADISFSANVEEEAFNWYPKLLRIICREALENSLEHTDAAPDVDIHLASTQFQGFDAVSISIMDAGPGIPESELKPIQQAAETPLEHATGIGLWAIKWGVDRGFGKVEFDENERGGATVRMTIPDLGEEFTYW